MTDVARKYATRSRQKAADSLTAQRSVALPPTLTPKSTGLSRHDLQLLHLKQRLLRQHQLKRSSTNIQDAVNATLVFAQEEAGTAVCIAPNGMILTCSHCVAETAEEFAKMEGKWQCLLFADGRVVKTTCVAWEPKRDLALLRVVAAQPHESNSATHPSFPAISLASSSPAPDAPLACIGHPGSEDLEASRPNQKTNYDILHLSTGAFRGYAAGQDVQDNSEIGALQHDCWTYWGHSGAPLVEGDTGKLVGVHSSWDEETGMRRGVGIEAVMEFLEIHAMLLR